MLQLHLYRISYHISKFECPGNDRMLDCEYLEFLWSSLVVTDMFGDLKEIIVSWLKCH